MSLSRRLQYNITVFFLFPNDPLTAIAVWCISKLRTLRIVENYVKFENKNKEIFCII